MSYVLKWRLETCWVADGAGQMEVPGAQTKILNNDFGGNGGFVPVPGGDSPNQGNFNTALSTVETNMQNGIAANLAQIQAFATGGG